MKISLRPMIWTEDFSGTINFYTEKLGFTARAVSEDWGWASLYLGDAGIMVSSPNKHETYQTIRFTSSFYFNTDAVDEMWAKLKDNAKVCYPIEDFDYGMREFAIYDNNGYLLQFGQEISGNE